MKPIKVLFVALIFAFCLASDQSSAQTQEKPEIPVPDLIAQGKTLYRTAKFRPALAKFVAALKQEPENDEALGLAAETAFRLDNQSAAREYLIRRAELPGQRESVKAYCFQRVAMTSWREAHDIIAKHAVVNESNVSYKLPDEAETKAKGKIEDGIKYAERALELRNEFADAYNIRNLLFAEAALAAEGEEKAEEYRRKSLEDLQMALTMARPDSKTTDGADFNYPTIRISEFAQSKQDDEIFAGPMLMAIEGGRPIKRPQPRFPSARPSKSPSDAKDPSGKGMTADGSAYSLGAGRGALTAAYAAGKVKVEVLVSTEGKVIFTHIVDGRSDLNGAALIAARNWTFEPAMLNGQPVQISGVITFDLKPGRPKTASSPASKP